VAAVGLALAVACGALVAFEHDPGERRRRRIAPGAALAACSALAFGVFFVATNAASDAGGVAWTVAVNRSTSFAALALVVAIGRRGLTYRSADLRPAAVIGLLDAGANALFALALTQGMTSTIGVIGSLYPVTTVVLATVILRERPRALQAAGVAGVLVGVGLVIAWSGA
jgi:drug/metabolite transporter (DMT)-like permease